MSHSTLPRPGTEQDDRGRARLASFEAPGPSLASGLLAAVVVFVFVFVSSSIAALPAFRFELQLPAILPLLVWAAAGGVESWTNHLIGWLEPWRRSFGVIGLVPWAFTLIFELVAPSTLSLPWWMVPLSATAAAIPVVVMAARSRAALVVPPPVTQAARPSLFILAVASVLVTYGAAKPSLLGASLQVIVAAVLVVAALRPGGVAQALTQWRPVQWMALTWASLVMWAAVVLPQFITWMANPWVVLGVVVAAGVPLFVSSLRAGQRS